ncbi:MAG: hypothetical protein FWD27_00595 [Coriobacteriia bacterium]|nr:hypothetical protein [Coriobacteriia bacterium]
MVKNIITDEDFELREFAEANGLRDVVIARDRKYATIRQTPDARRFVIYIGRSYRGWSKEYEVAIRKAKELLAVMSGDKYVAA